MKDTQGFVHEKEGKPPREPGSDEAALIVAEACFVMHGAGGRLRPEESSPA